MRIAITLFCCLLVGLSAALGQSDKSLTIAFTDIDSLQYMKFKKEYTSHLVVDSTKKTTPGASFSLPIENKIQQFDCQKDFSDCHYYKGFLPSLNSFVITHCTRQICGTFLVDATSGERQGLFSSFDNECESPVLSKDHTKMLVFASDVFDKASYISIYHRANKKEKFDFKSFASLSTNKWRIFEVVWINDTRIALMIFDQYGGQTGNELLNVKYIQGEIKY